jgi:hypothetical protein
MDGCECKDGEMIWGGVREKCEFHVRDSRNLLT